MNPTPAAPAVDTPAEPDLPDGWWEEDAAEAARADRRYWTRDED